MPGQLPQREQSLSVPLSGTAFSHSSKRNLHVPFGQAMSPLRLREQCHQNSARQVIGHTLSLNFGAKSARKQYTVHHMGVYLLPVCDLLMVTMISTVLASHYQTTHYLLTTPHYYSATTDQTSYHSATNATHDDRSPQVLPQQDVLARGIYITLNFEVGRSPAVALRVVEGSARLRLCPAGSSSG